MQSLVDAVARDLHADVRTAGRLGGGDVAESYRFELADGRTCVFAKTHRDPPPHFFTTEANGLRWLRQPGVMPVPEVLAVSDGDDGSPPRLVLEWIEQARRVSPEGEAAFGRALARLHRAGSPCFGRADGRTTGSLGLPNDPCDTWVEFYGQRRLVSCSDWRTIGRRCRHPRISKLQLTIERLEEFGGSPEPPARLHGDLWPETG
jgi:fructosamine-3-kinase